MTIFGEILPLWQQHCKSIWPCFVMVLISIWQTFVPTSAIYYATGQIFIVVNGQRLKNNLAIWSHWTTAATTTTPDSANVATAETFLRKNKQKIWRLHIVYKVCGAAIAQWIRLHLPSCCPGFDYQAQHLHFLNLSVTWYDKWLVFCSTSASMAAKSAKILRSPTLELLGRTMRTARLSL